MISFPHCAKCLCSVNLFKPGVMLGSKCCRIEKLDIKSKKKNLVDEERQKNGKVVLRESILTNIVQRKNEILAKAKVQKKQLAGMTRERY